MRGLQIAVLDHGYVEMVEPWGTGKAGTDAATDGHPDYEVGIIEAARQSTHGSFRGWEQDEKLLQHLYSNNHDSPFEFAGLVLEIQAPIFVFREWHRHRTQSYNEMSARYSPLPAIYYMPGGEDVYDRAVQALVTRNKQAGSESLLQPSRDLISHWLIEQEAMYDRWEIHYKYGLSIGIPKEIARIGMPVGHYSRMRAHANLRNWLAFMTLRCDPHAQWEIRQFANVVATCIGEAFPKTHALWSAARA